MNASTLSEFGGAAPLITRILVGLIAGGLAYRLFKRRLSGVCSKGCEAMSKIISDCMTGRV
jgi:hypothetical protein